MHRRGKENQGHTAPSGGVREERQPQKKQSCAAIDFRPFRFLADKAAVAADFQLRKWRLPTRGTENKHSNNKSSSNAAWYDRDFLAE